MLQSIQLSSGISAFLVPGAVGGDTTLSGKWAAMIPQTRLETYQGPLAFPPNEPWGIHYTRVTDVGGFKLVGQGHTGLHTWEWANSTWTDHQPAAGESPFIFDNAGNLLPPVPGANGYRQVLPDGTVILGETTVVARHGLNKYSYLPDGLFIGQGNAAGGLVVFDGQALRVIDATTAIQFINVHYDIAGNIAIAYTRTDGVVFVYPTLDALKQAPVFMAPAPPAPAPVPVPVPTPKPIPSPTPKPMPPTSFDPAVVQFVDSPGDLASWPQTATITSVRFDGDRFQVDHTGRASWPDLPFGDGSAGTVQYTLGVCCFVSGQWVGSAVVQFWKGRELTAGGGVSTFATDWFYDGRWGALQGHQPQPGDLVAVFAAAGNDRDNSHPPSGQNRQRTDFALVTWGQPYSANTPVPAPIPAPVPPTPIPVPSPAPAPVPVPVDDPRFAALQAAIDDLQAQITALPVSSQIDLSAYAKKGDRVTVLETLFGTKLVLHGTIDK